MKTVACFQVERFSISDDMTVNVQSKPVPFGAGQGDAEVRDLLYSSLYVVSLEQGFQRLSGYLCYFCFFRWTQPQT